MKQVWGSREFDVRKVPHARNVAARYASSIFPNERRMYRGPLLPEERQDGQQLELGRKRLSL